MVFSNSRGSAELFAPLRGKRLFHWLLVVLFILFWVLGYLWAEFVAVWAGIPIEFVKGLCAVPALILITRGVAQTGGIRLRRGPPQGQLLSDYLQETTDAAMGAKAHTVVTDAGLSTERPHSQFLHWEDVQWFVPYSTWRGMFGARVKVRYARPNGSCGVMKFPVETRDREETARFQTVLSQYWPGWDRPRSEQPKAQRHFVSY